MFWLRNKKINFLVCNIKLQVLSDTVYLGPAEEDIKAGQYQLAREIFHSNGISLVG